ncbi:hypothetical protein ACG9XR_23895, partial [Acinetobacter guillouiae]
FLPYAARIEKKENLKYMDQNMGDVVDPTVKLSPKDLQEILSKTNRLVFNLYNNDVRVDIVINRTYKDDKKEQDMVRYSFEHFKYAGRNAISDSDTMSSE